MKEYGILISMAGKGRYRNPDAPEKLIRYITRTNGKPDDDLIAWGGLGVTEDAGADAVAGQFGTVQGTYGRGGSFGRYMDHEVFSLSEEAERALADCHADPDGIARRMARDIYENDHC